MEVYSAVRILNVSITELTVKIFNETIVEISNILSIQNPSQIGFQTFGVEQTIFLNRQSIAYARLSEPSVMYPLQIPPRSNLSLVVKVNAVVSPEVTESILHSSTNKWFTRTYIFLDGPMIGQFSFEIRKEIPAIIVGEH
jgi:hypothetical protein